METMATPRAAAVLLLPVALLLAGTAEPGTAVTGGDPAAWWGDEADGADGGVLSVTAPDGETYDIRLTVSSVFLKERPEDRVDQTVVVLRGDSGAATAAMVLREDSVRLVVDTPEGTYRVDQPPLEDEGPARQAAPHPSSGPGLRSVEWNGVPLATAFAAAGTAPSG